MFLIVPPVPSQKVMPMKQDSNLLLSDNFLTSPRDKASLPSVAVFRHVNIFLSLVLWSKTVKADVKVEREMLKTQPPQSAKDEQLIAFIIVILNWYVTW